MYKVGTWLLTNKEGRGDEPVLNEGNAGACEDYTEVILTLRVL